jgi:DNA (cytosine-5)-methyltransferase 1
MRTKIRVTELYAGTARSLQPFLSWRKAQIALLADNNELARKTYLHNFPDAPYRTLNLDAVSPDEVVRLAGGRIDVLLGCPPCQGFSEGGKRSPNDPRNAHLKLFADVALSSKPRVIAMENVPLAAVSSEFAEMTHRLEAAGYQWTAAIVNSAQFGSCQTRQRLLFVAFDEKMGVKPKFPAPTHGSNLRLFSYARSEFQGIRKHNVVEMLGIAPASQRVAGHMPENFLLKIGRRKCPTVEDTIDDLPPADSEAATSVQHVMWRHSTAMRRRMANVRQGGRWSGAADHYSHTYGRLHMKGLARTITASFPYAGSGRYWHPTKNRSITLREAARIQGFPDGFRFIEPAATKENAQLVGNALDAQLAQVTYEVIRGPLEEIGPKSGG